MTAAPFALVREVSRTFSECLTARPPDPPLDPDRAKMQLAGYVGALSAGGFVVRALEGDDAHPDASFIEDAAVVLRDAALVARPGHPSRRGEVGAVAAALRELVDVEEMVGPATLDGGDVLRLAGRLYVGVGRRTNLEGLAVLARFAARFGFEVTAVDAGPALHLKTAASPLDDETVLANVRFVDPTMFGDARVVAVDHPDAGAGNVVRLADGSLLAAEHLPETVDLLVGRGHVVHTVDIGEFARADGGPTCLSLRVR